MKAIVLHEAGGPGNLILEERPTPQVRDGWSLVRVKGFGINHSEIFTRKGLSPTVRFPRILGIECVGVLERSTDPVRLPEGIRVVSIMGEMGRAFDGGYAEYVLLPNEQIYPVSTALSWENLAAVPETFYTAYGAFCNLKVHKETSVLVRGASSGVGIAFLKLLKGKYPDAFVTGTSRKAAKAEKLIRKGFDRILMDRDGSIDEAEKYDRILELIGPKTIRDSLLHLRDSGIICSAGQLGGQWFLEDFDPIMELQNNVYLTTFYSGNVSVEKRKEMFSFIEANHVDVQPEKVFSLEQVPEAHRWLEQSCGYGKCVVVI
jgi:NADPH:quinone reductase-like Zn-dependent oxidoreductase